MRSRVVNDVTHYLYESEEEFREHYPDEEIIYWKEGQPGDWVRLDDGGICQVIRFYKMGENPPAVQTIAGLYNPARNLEATSDLNRYIHSFSKQVNDYVSRKGHDKLGTTRSNPSDEEVAFFWKVFRGMKPTEAYLEAFEQAKSRPYARNRARVLLRTERIQKMVKEHVIDTLEDCGVTDEFIIEGYKQIIDSGDDEHAKDRIAALDRLAEMKGLMNEDKDVKSKYLVAEHTQELFPKEQMKKIEGLMEKVESFDPKNVEGLPDEFDDYEEVEEEK